MKIWWYYGNVESYDQFWSDEFSLADARQFDGKKQLKTWVPRHVVRRYPEKGLPLGDSAVFPYAMAAVDERARNLLYPLVKDDVEFLPLYYGENQYYVLNVTTVLDCIDYERAEYLNFPNGGRIMRFTKYAFDESKIGDTHIFKIVDEKRKAPFVSDQFVECIEENGLTGFTFELLWDRGEGVELGNMFFPDKDRVFKHF